jgi:branched-chain amino acid transport system permease protein
MQVLLTYGLSVIFADLMRWGFGAEIVSPQIPDLLRGVVFVLDIPFPIYRLFIIGFGLALALGLWLLIDRPSGALWSGPARLTAASSRRSASTRAASSRSSSSSRQGLGGLSGALGSGILSAHPGLDEEVLLLALIVVVVGGLGTFRGTVMSALLLGFVTTFARVWTPEFSNVVPWPPWR